MKVPAGTSGIRRGSKFTFFRPTPTSATASAVLPRRRYSSTWNAPKLYPTRPSGRPGPIVRAERTAADRSSTSYRPPLHSPALAPTPRKLNRSAYQPRSAHARAIAAMIGVRIVPPWVGSACAITTIAVGWTSGMRSVASSRSSMRRASSRMIEVCGNRHRQSAVYAFDIRPLVARFGLLALIAAVACQAAQAPGPSRSPAPTPTQSYPSREGTCAMRVSASFTLANDLTCAGDGMVVIADNVTVDLGGHNLTRPGLG